MKNNKRHDPMGGITHLQSNIMSRQNADVDKTKRYTITMDVGYPVYETKEFASDQEALEYGKKKLHSTNATSVAVYEGQKQIGDFDCADEL